MKTITFYSYKGGVGRTLALSNIAKRLNEFGKKVFIIDFDLEAPGIHYKFKDFLSRDKVKLGLVDYIHEFCVNGHIDSDIKKYVRSFRIKASTHSEINLMCAGNNSATEYWKKLSSINWSDMFYKEDSVGIEFFLNLKEVIKKKYKPDYLLIDSRTGFTETSAITMSILADEVMVLSANNLENIEGSRQIIKAINRTLSIGQKRVKTHFVLTRIPGTDTPEDKVNKKKIISQAFYLLNLECSSEEKLVDKIHVIHTDRELEVEEKLKIGTEHKSDSVSISNDYFELLKVIGNFSEKELSQYNSILKSDEVYQRALRLPRDKVFERELKFALQLNPNNVNILEQLAIYYYQNLLKEEEITVLRKAIEIEPQKTSLLNHIGFSLVSIFRFNGDIQKGKEGLDFMKRAVDIEKGNSRINIFYEVMYCHSLKRVNGLSGDEVGIMLEELLRRFPNSSTIYNSMAVNYQESGDLKKAYDFIYKALEQDSVDPTLKTTLAEINAMDNKENEFYYNLDLALKAGYGIDGFFYYHEFYQRYFDDERFLNLLDKYDVLDSFYKLLERFKELIKPVGKN